MVVQQTSKSVVIGGIIGEFLRAKETKLKKIRVFLQLKNLWLLLQPLIR
jgi:hypothetical protein